MRGYSMFDKLIQRTKTKMQRAGAWVASAATNVTSGFHKVVANVADFCGNKELCESEKRLQKEYESKNEIWRRRLDELKVKDRFETNWAEAESPDVKIVKEVTTFFDQRYEHKAKKTIASMSPLERTKEVEDVALKLGEIMGVKVNRVIIYIPDHQENNYCGYYNRSEETININIRQLFSEDSRALVDVISTVAHELYHARQWNAVSGKEDYGYSAEKIVEWGENFLRYYPPEYGPLYYYQPLESSARGFENAIKDSLK